MAADFRRCYNRSLFDDGKMKGSVRLTGKIGSDGAIIIATASDEQGLSPQLVDCLKRRLLAQRFQPPTGGGATVVVPITLEPQ